MSTSTTLTRLAKRRVYSEQEFKQADQLDRILIHLVNPHTYQINSKDETKLNDMRKCFSILAKGYTEEAIDALIADAFPGKSKQTINKLRQDTERFYRDKPEENKEFNRIKEIELLKRHMKMAEDNGDHKSLTKYHVLLITLQKLNIEEIADKPRDRVLHPITLSADPSLIEDAQVVEDGGN